MRLILVASTFLFSLNLYAFNDFEDALTSYNTNEIDQAYIHLKNVLKDDENNLPANVLMGRVLLKKGLYLEGIEVLQDALERGADINFIINDLTSALMINNAFDDVIRLTSNKNLTKESKLTAFLLAGNAYVILNDHENAKIYYQKAYTLEPNNLRTLSALSSYKLERKNYNDAEFYIDKALKLFPKESRVWNLKGQLHDTKSQYELALKAYKQGYKVNPKDPFIQRALANAYANANKNEDALKLVESILQKTPDDPFAKLLKSRLLASTSRTEESNQILVDISQKLSLLSDSEKNSNVSLALVAGTSAYLQNNLEIAQKELQYYVIEKPKDLSGISLLVDIYLKQNQKEKAFELLEKKYSVIKDNLKLSKKLFELYLSDNKVYKAEQILVPLEKTYGKSLTFVLAKANLLAKNNEMQQALTLLNKNKPQKFSASYELTKGLLLADDGQINKAHIIANNLLKRNKLNIDYLNFKATLFLKEKKWDESLTYLNKILEQQPNNFSALFNSATANAASSKLDEAHTIAYRLLGLQPENITLKMLTAKIEKDIGNGYDARKLLNEILSNKSTYIPAIELLMEISYQEREYEEALEQADRLSKLSFLNPKYIEMKAKIYIKLNDLINAKKQLQVLSGVVTTVQEIFELSQMQMKANDLSGAKASLEKATIIEPSNVYIQRELVKLEIDSGNFSRADEILVNLEKDSQNDANVLMLRGDLYLKQNNKAIAQQHYLKAINIDNNFNMALFKSYYLAIEKINESGFVKTVQKALKTNNKNYLMRTVYADFLLANGKKNEAKKHYEKLINVENISNKASIFNNLANIYISIDLTKAESFSKDSIALNDKSPEILDTYGWILSLNNKFDESLSVLRKAYSMSSNNPTINYHIGYALVKLNRKEEAKEELKKAINHGAAFAEYKGAVKLLETL